MTTEFCAGPPPFRFGYLPAGMRPDLQQLDPEREGKELYDPIFFLGGVGDSRLHLFHGNSWRLNPIPKRELTVLDRPGVLSVFSHGDVLVEFRIGSTGSACDWWGIAGVQVPEEVVLRVVQELQLA